MTIEDFFELFLDELRQNSELRSYYRFLNNEALFDYRKAYFIQRLQYINTRLSDKSAKIFDIGCGYGTTAIYLTLNGYRVHGTTLEFYFEQIAKRRDYWQRFGSLDGFTVAYENLFDNPPPGDSFDVIIAQDVLHHLEPLNKGLAIIRNSMKKSGLLIACEENGNNLVNSTRLFIKRGNRKVIRMFDDKLDKEILIGNENIRSLRKWTREMIRQNLKINEKDIEYVRLFPPFKYKRTGTDGVIASEQKLWKRHPMLREYFYHGVNFTVSKD